MYLFNDFPLTNELLKELFDVCSQGKQKASYLIIGLRWLLSLCCVVPKQAHTHRTCIMAWSLDNILIQLISRQFIAIHFKFQFMS